MSVIFGFSTGAGSTRHTSRIIGPALRWLVPDITDATIAHVQTGIRKSAHLSEYALLALLLWRARRKPCADDPRPWSWRTAALAFAVAVLFAAGDEFHQSFVPSREGRFRDVLIDTTGAALGLLALWALGRWRKYW